jgi:cbb3-type cytochrome oxidase subunit 3
MKRILLFLIAILAASALIIALIIRSKARRQFQKSKNNILKLKDGKANYEFDLPNIYSDSSLLKIRQLLDEYNFRIIENVDNGLIAYSGKSEEAVLNGWLNANPLTLPFRVVVSSSLNNTIKVKFADDYGFQVLNASQKQKFNNAYNPIFMHYEALIENHLN